MTSRIFWVVEWRQAIDALKESEQRLSEIINFLPDATFAIDSGGRVIAWNKAIEEMTGVPAADIMGKGDFEYSLAFYDIRHPILIDLIKKSKEELEKYSYSVQKQEANVICRSKGSSPPAENTAYSLQRLPCSMTNRVTLPGRSNPSVMLRK